MHIQDIDIIGQLADLKEIDYRNTLAIATLIELAIEKGLFTRQEFARKAKDLDTATISEVNSMRASTGHRESGVGNRDYQKTTK